MKNSDIMDMVMSIIIANMVNLIFGFISRINIRIFKRNGLIIVAMSIMIISLVTIAFHNFMNKRIMEECR